MNARRDRFAYQPTDFERAPWTAIIPAALCGVTAVVSAITLGVRVWSGLRSGDAVTFYAIPTVLFDGAPRFALATYLVFVIPWTVATVAACRRLFFPQRNAHRSLALLLVPALALNFVAYAAIVSAGRSLSDAHLPFGLWFAIGVVTVGFLAAKPTRQFEATGSYPQTSWRDVDLDDGT